MVPFIFCYLSWLLFSATVKSKMEGVEPHIVRLISGESWDKGSKSFVVLYLNYAQIWNGIGTTK